MDQFLDFLRELLKPYADQHHLSFLITNRKGLPVETVNGHGHRLAFLDYLDEILLESYEQIVVKLNDVSMPVPYDIQIPGVHVLVIPVKSLDGNEYYIWTGALLEEHNPDTLFGYLSRASQNPQKWVHIFMDMPMLSLADLGLISSRLNTIANLASQYLKTKNNEADYKVQIDMIQQLTNAMNSDRNLSISSLLDSFLIYMKGIEMCGYALKVEENTYRFVELRGLEQSDLIGVEFHSGEGFLGQIGLYEQLRSMQGAVDDSRLHLFQQRGICPNHIYGAPVRDESGVCGIFFVGTLDPHIHYSEHVSLTLQVITDLYGSFLVTKNNRTKLNRQKAYLTSLGEVSRVMNTVHDLRRLLFILIDISMNLVIGSNAAYLIYHEPGKVKAQIVSRGISVEQVELYTHEVLKKRAAIMEEEPDSMKLPYMSIQHTSWGEQVLECRIVCRGEVRGLLSVSLPDLLNVEEYMIVFETYVYLAGIALERLISEEQVDHDQKIISLLYEALGCWNQTEYENSRRLKETALDFATYLHLPNEIKSTIEFACLISSYPIEFVGQQQLSPDVVKLREEFHQASSTDAEAGATYSIPCQVMVLSMSKIKDNTEQAPPDIKGIELVIQHKFDSFILRDQVVNYEITIDEPELGTVKLIDFEVFRQTTQISTREQEVLELIVQGLQNRDIAEALFISEHTVKNHITKLFQKLKVSDRSQAIALAYKIGFQS